MARDYYVVITAEQARTILGTLPNIYELCTTVRDRETVYELQKRIEGISGWVDRGTPWKQLVLSTSEALWLQTISDVLELGMSIPGMRSEPVHRENETT